MTPVTLEQLRAATDALGRPPGVGSAGGGGQAGRVGNLADGPTPAGAMELARAALARHGPAVQGQHGDEHTYVAARIAWNDHALSKEDSWTVLAEWNVTCLPPWDEAGLRKKLDSAVRHGADNRGRALRPGPQTPANEAGWRLAPVSSAALLAGDHRPDWLIPDVLVRGQPAIIGGPPKTLKTSIMVDLAVSLAAGKPFLARFPVSTPGRVMFSSGESGQATLAETLRRVSQAKGIDPAELDVHWQFDLPQLGRPADLAALRDGVAVLRPAVLILDPLYLSLLAGGDRAVDERSVFQMGSHLRQVAQVCLEHGTTPVLVHHARRGVKAGTVMDLEHFAYAGFAEFARQWLLLSRRMKYQRDGVHELWLAVGGSAGHGGQYRMTIDEGVSRDGGPDRRWAVSVRSDDDLAGGTDPGVDRRRTRETEQEDKVLAVIDTASTASSPTRNEISKKTGMNSANVNKVVDRLLATGRIEEHCYRKQTGASRRDVVGYRRPAAPPPERGGTGTGKPREPKRARRARNAKEE